MQDTYQWYCLMCSVEWKWEDVTETMVVQEYHAGKRPLQSLIPKTAFCPVTKLWSCHAVLL